MQRFVNDPDYIVDDMLVGYLEAHRELELSPRNSRVVSRRNRNLNRVGLITGGGSGHEPAFLGYIGEGLLDSVAVGEVFASPPALAFKDAILEADGGKGVVCLIGNYAGDTMNVKLAIDQASKDGITVRSVVATDDIASSPKESAEKRHGLAGGVFMWKTAGAAAVRGEDLNRVTAVAQKTVDRTRSICAGLAPLTIPAVGKPGFTIEPGHMEFGIGHHGEPGIRAEELKSASATGEGMTDALLADFEFTGPRRLGVMLSGLGATPSMELYVLYGAVAKRLKENGHSIALSYVGDFVTSLDMNGVALTFIDLDDELIELLTDPATPAGLPRYGKTHS